MHRVVAVQLKPALARALDVVGRARAAAVGGSMWPFVATGSFWIERVADDDLHIGDVVAFQEDCGALVLHRVVETAGERVRVRGDAQAEAQWIDHAQIVGRLRGIAIGRRQWPEAPRRWSHRYGRAVVAMAPLVRVSLSAARAAWARSARHTITPMPQ